MTTLTVHRDQAVWERETLYIDVPDDLPPDQHYDFVVDYLAEHPVFDDSPSILNSIEGIDTMIEIAE